MATFSAYPVIDGDLSKVQGKGPYKNYDANFIPVVPKDPLSLNEVSYYPCRPGRKNVYTELVTFESASCLPRYLVKLQPDMVKSPAILPPAIPPAASHLPPGEQVFRDGLVLFSTGQYRQAIPLFEQSAASGHPPACLYLYLIYSQGRGVPIDRARSDLWGQQVAGQIGWFREQAETGQAEARLNLGRCYYDGLGVKKDLTQAVRYFRLAADQGQAGAQFNLGVCYQHGRGVTQDLALALAVRYYQLAADQGDADAQRNLQNAKARQNDENCVIN